MMIFAYTFENVIKELKTQTSRIYTPGDCAFDDDFHNGVIAAVTNNKGRIRYEVGKHCAVQPGRGKYGVYYRCLTDGKLQYWHTHNQGFPCKISLDDEWKSYKPARIYIQSIERRDVRTYTDAEIVAEGFQCATDFFMVWCKMHDKGIWLPAIPDYNSGKIEWHGLKSDLDARPAKRYDAWKLTFELVKDAK